jgi:elongation factor Tu
VNFVQIIPFEDRVPDVEAEISFNKIKQRAVTNGYRPGHQIKDGYITTGVHKYYYVDVVMPGETVLGTITFITPEVYPNTLWIGKEIGIYEGGRKVGVALITRIFNPILKLMDD